MPLLMKKNRLSVMFHSPQTALIGGFAGAILVGAIILRLPWANQPGKVNFVDALFTATSAVCVTGLAVVDTGTDYTFFGQVVILLLIQAGGLGVMSFAAVAFQLLGRGMSLQSEAVLHDTFFQRDMAAEFQRTFRTILSLTASIEGIGACFLFFLLLPRMELGPAAFSSIFHSVSAFCNAGFSLRNDNLIGLRDSGGILFVIMALIVLGGLGYTVLNEIYSHCKYSNRGKKRDGPNRFSFHARLVLWVTSFLITGGAATLLVFGMTPDEFSWWDQTFNALFQSVTARTAGFNSVDIGKLPSASLFILIILMFIGGSPASCAGGIKTTSAAILWARSVAGLRGQREVKLLDRRIPHELISRTDLLIALALFWNMAGVLFLFTTEAGLPVDTLDLVFEQISAFGTVGLSTGLTPDLSVPGKLWLVATMFVGRLGPLTIALWMIPATNVSVRYPKGSVMIG